MSPHHVPDLVDDAVEEVLLRCPPDDPARLLRAALACRRWRRRASSPSFRRRYAERHRAGGSVLGFVCNLAHRFNNGADEAHFLPTTLSSFRLPARAAAVHHKMRALDARHGRVLLQEIEPPTSSSSYRTRLAVWNPITGERRDLPILPVVVRSSCWNAAVLCAAAAGDGGCNHLSCHRGHFRVVVVGVDVEQKHAFSCAYSSEPGGVWSVRTADTISEHPGCCFEQKPSALAGNALYFTFETGHGYIRILKYDLVTEQMTVMKLPRTGFHCPRIVFMTMEDGNLGFAIVGVSKLHLWLAVLDGSDSGVQWYRSGVIDLKTLLPANAFKASLGVVGFAGGGGGGGGVIFMGTAVGNFVVDLKSSRVIKLGDGRRFHSVVPFTSFCIPR